MNNLKEVTSNLYSKGHTQRVQDKKVTSTLWKGINTLGKGINKRGSHVGFMLSFVIFITFLIFMYIIINPAIKTKSNKELSLDHLEKEIKKKVSDNLITVAITGNASDNRIKCLTINNSNLNLNRLNYTVNYLGDLIPVNLSGDELRLAWYDHTRNLFKINYANESFKIQEASVINCSKAKVEYVKKDDYVFETKIIKLIQDYSIDYDSLKANLDIAPSDEFSFSFTYNNQTTIGTGQKNVSISGSGRKFSVHYINQLANINQGVMTINIW